MRFDDLTYHAKDYVSRNKRSVITGALAAVLLLAATVLFARMIFGSGGEKVDVPGLERRATKSERQQVETAQQEREQNAERLRREAEAMGEDPDANPRRAGGSG